MSDRISVEMEALVDSVSGDPVALNAEIERLSVEKGKLKSNAKPSKSDARKTAEKILESWITRRGVTGLDRARKSYLLDDLAEAFGAPEVKQGEGIA